VGVDAEVGQALEQRLARALDRLRGVARDLLRAAQDARVGEAVIGVLARRWVEKRRGLDRRELSLLQLIEQDDRRRRRVRDDIGILLLAVDRRSPGMLDLGVGHDTNALDRPARDLRRPSGGARRMAKEGAERGTGDEDPSRDDEKEAENRRPGLPEEPAEDRVEAAPDGPAPLLAEHRHDSESKSDEAGPERAHVDELGAGDEETAHGDEEERQRQAGAADERVERGVDLAPDDAAVPLEPEHDREKEAERKQAEAGELGVLPTLRPPPRPLRPPDPGGCLRA
jgi:hypothetical protein